MAWTMTRFSRVSDKMARSLCDTLGLLGNTKVVVMIYWGCGGDTLELWSCLTGAGGVAIVLWFALGLLWGYTGSGAVVMPY